MNSELDKQLCEKYPELFRGRNKSMKETLMCWGFDCGNGWFELIDNLCFDIKVYCELHNTEVPEVVQVKEKFGGLRFYLGGVDENHVETIYKLIDQAEGRSYRICDVCGKPGILRGYGWLSTRCDEHSEGQEPYEEPTT